MRYRLTLDLDTEQNLTLWDVAHAVPFLVSLCLAEIRPEDMTRLSLRKIDGPEVALALEGGEEIDIRELLGS